MSDKPLAVIIMAAGQGKRMQDPSKAKVLYPLAGKPMLGHVLTLCSKLECARSICIVGFAREHVAQYVQTEFPGVLIAIQQEQLGTGHAVQQAEPEMLNFEGDVLVLSGDVPLLSIETVRRLIMTHRLKCALATVLAVRLSDPTGYGRIVRNKTGNLERIVEEKDASSEERALREINTGIYVFDCRALFDALKFVDRRNAQGEYYLTDTLALIAARYGSDSVAVELTGDEAEVAGVNTKIQLEELEAEYLRRTGPSSGE